MKFEIIVGQEAIRFNSKASIMYLTQIAMDRVAALETLIAPLYILPVIPEFDKEKY